jgi:mRNA interferase MazF
MASRSEIWLTNFGPPYPAEPAHCRPALIVGPAYDLPRVLPFVIVVPMTSTRRGISLHVEIEPSLDTGLTETSYIQCELVRSINQNRLISKFGHIDMAHTFAVEKILKTLFGF